MFTLELERNCKRHWLQLHPEQFQCQSGSNKREETGEMQRGMHRKTAEAVDRVKEQREQWRRMKAISHLPKMKGR